MKRLFPLSLLVVALTLLLPVAASAQTVTVEYTLNWAGYVATTNGKTAPFTSVSATWTVPEVTGPNLSYSSVWVGIGGATRGSSKLIQAGTEQDVDSSGNITYSVWYEVYPQFPVTIDVVSPGNNVSVSIYRNEGKPQTWHIAVSYGTNEFNKDVKLNPNFFSEATAEFIVERPLLVVGHQLAALADFGSAAFSGCTTNLGDLGKLGSVQKTYQKTYMTSNGFSSGTPLASPSDLSGNGFTVYYGTAS